MRKIILLLIPVIIGIHSPLFAQLNSEKPLPEESTTLYEVPEQAILYNFHVKLDKGNSLEIKLTNLQDMKRILNMDSVIAEFKNNVDSFADSLSDPLNIKSIKYLTDASDRIFIRTQQFVPEARDFLLTDHQKAPVKLRQDTVEIIRVVTGEDSYFKSSHFPKRYIQLTFCLNDYHQLYGYRNRNLNTTLSKIYLAAEKIPVKPKNYKKGLSGNYSLSGTASGAKPDIHLAFDKESTTSLTLLFGGNLQNVYQNMAPSLTLGVLFDFPKAGLDRQLELAWEPLFLFKKDKNDFFKTYRNDWLLIGYRIHNMGKGNFMFTQTAFSLSYLIRNKGGFFKDHTFRLGLGGVGMDHSRIFLQPVLYFHDFFKGITPGLRLSVSL